MKNLFVLVVIIVAVLGFEYLKKKRAEELYDEITLKTDAEEQKPRGIGEIILDYQYMLFDQFVRNTWPDNYLCWEMDSPYPLSYQFEGYQRIKVKRTDGTYHTEVIKVEKKEKSQNGLTFDFIVQDQKENNPNPKPEPENPKPKKPDNKPDNEPEKAPLSKKERAAKWVKENIGWIESELETGWILIKFGTGEREIPEDIKNEVFTEIDNIGTFQESIEKDGIGVYPMSDI